MLVKVNRLWLNAAATVGRLYLDDTYQCYTLEDRYREIAGEAVEQWKVPGQTAIPAGTYDLAFSWSAKFGREMPLLLGVSGFSEVRFHWGNTDVDTEGCILVGQTKVGTDFIGDSRNAFSLLFLALRSAAAREPVRVQIAVDAAASDNRFPSGNIPRTTASKDTSQQSR